MGLLIFLLSIAMADGYLKMDWWLAVGAQYGSPTGNCLITGSHRWLWPGSRQMQLDRSKGEIIPDPAAPSAM